MAPPALVMDSIASVASSDLPSKSKLNGTVMNGYSEHPTNGIAGGDHLTNTNRLSEAKLHGGDQVPIAICGMACRLPGGLTTPEDFWNFLLAKKDGRCRVPESRYNISAYYSATPKPGTISTEYGYFLDESIDLGALDSSFFTLPRTEVERADPQQRLMLEVTRECFEDAGLTNWRGKTIGCYIGNFGEDWLEMFSKEAQQWGMHRIVGTGDFVISNRLSYEFDIKGPSMTIRTGCSAALVALNEACAAISKGDCEGALVGGVNLILGPGMTAAMTEQGILSKDGMCKTFSAQANGYARGEAATAIYIKPLADAIRDGNPIRAVIRGTSHNVDGKTPGISQPSTDAQEALMRRAYQVAGISDFSKTAMVECHGTGTAIGDPIEARAVARVFGEKGVYIGSVKPNMGHTEGASGLVSLIKMVMALENRTIPPNIFFKTPNPNIPFEEGKLTVPLEPTPWPEDRLERISLNSFGVGGANAHAILESAAAYNVSAVTPEAQQTPQLLLYTANSAKSLATVIDNYQTWVEKHPNKISDLAYTLGVRREHLPHRAFAIVNNNIIESVSPPANVKSAKKPNIVMVFTGQGAQWPQMGRELLQSNETFKSSIRSLDQHLQNIAGVKPQYSIEEELKKPAKKSRLSSAELSQPLCTAIQISLVDTLRSLGVTPSAVVGHSSGEIAAAYASGALTAGEAITAAHHRGAVTTRQKREGAMAAIGMSWEETEKHLIQNVTIACDNSPKSVTISGDVDAVKAVVEEVKVAHPDVMARLLQVDKAYHSYHMAEIGDDYLSLIDQEVIGREPSALFFSSVTGKLLAGEGKIGPKYWQDNLESPVRFRAAVTAILNHEVGKDAVFLEIGPHSALAGPLRQIFTHASTPSPYLSAMIRAQNCTVSLLSAIGKLHSLNVPINLQAVFPVGTCLPDLPRYPWNHEDSYWYEARVSKEWRHRKHPYHDLLGVKVPESTELEPTWRNLFHLTNAPWIRDHMIGDNIVFPFAGYIAMVGEAVRQISDIGEGFSVRNIIVNTALVLNEGKPTEIVSSFRPYRLTTSLNSSWWEFTVSSFNGHAWTKHCTGEVVALSSDLGLGSDPNVLPRKVNAKKYYENMCKGGLDLGPCFQTLENIETSTNSDNRATGNVINGRQGDEHNYHIHPTVIDGTIQLLGAAAVNGNMRKTKNWLPTRIDEISIMRCASNMITSVSAKLSSNHSVIGDGRCTTEGRTVIKATGIRMSLANGGISTEDSNNHAAARYEWGPDIDFLDVKELISSPTGRTDQLRLLEELGKLCLLSSKRQFSNSESNVPHLQKYIVWLVSQAQSAATDFASAPESLENEAITTKIEELVGQLSNTPAATAASAIHQVYQNMGRLLSCEAPEEIFSQGTLTNLSEFVEQLDRTEFIRKLSHSKPNLRILEIGTAEKSAPQADILSELTRPDGQILCSKYTFTSPGFVWGNGQEQLFRNMESLTLDIGQDPSEQGFEDRQYDLIIAPNALQTTKNIQESLKNIKKLLRPDGRLLLQEICPSSKWINYVLGVLPTWWLGTADGQTGKPSLDVKWWESQLSAAGLGGIEGVIFDAEEPHQLTANIVTRHTSAPVEGPRRITVLHENQGAIAERVLNQLNKEGYQVATCKLGDVPPPSQDIISLLDLDKPFFEMIDEARFQNFKDFLHNMHDAGIFWVTHLTEIGCRDPRYAQVLGLARVIRSEMLADFAICQVDDLSESVAVEKVIQVLAKFQARQGDDTLNADFEWAILDSQVKVGRFHPFELSNELLESGPGEKAILDVHTPGRINSLHWAEQPREDLKDNEVEVQVHSAGLNFRDILVALGIVELPIRQFGLEAAGIVTRVGAEVDPEELKVGDRVFCLKKQAYSTYITTPTTFCTRIPDDLSFDEAAAMLMPYVTSIHGLVNVARLTKGQTVLVHSACGGVGLAAVQISQMIGAELYVTVSNEEKVKHLMDNFHIPRNRIFHSRDKSFVDGIMRETEGRGIDVILNSLSGELLHATWECVAEFGTLVEIGKRDLIGNGKLDMKPFLDNRSYCCIDIDQLWKKPVLLRKLILSTLEYCVKGYTTPVRPTKVFPASQAQDAFRYMQKGQHIGRVGISIQHPADEAGIAFETVKRARPITFNGDASYLLVGGLGGLGRAISTWMVDNGARELLYLSRSAGVGTKDDTFVEELQSMGCNVKLVRGDVTQAEDVKRATAMATNPLKGIIQMSMVNRDQNFTKMTFDDWTTASMPKVQGTWNLHHATVDAGADLDFFLLFSSLSGIIGQPGQANYASANTFLDAFAQYRNGLGLAASVVDIGAVEGIGFISEHQGLMNKMKMSGFKGVIEQELLDALAVAMTVHSRPAVKVTGNPNFSNPNGFVLGLGSTIPLNSPSNLAIWRKDRRMAAYHNVSGDSATTAASEETLKSYLAGVKADPSLLKSAETVKVFAVEIGKKLFDLLLKPQEEVNTTLSLVDLGLDSLVALELRAWWKQVFSFDITVLEMLGMGSLEALGQHAADELLKIDSETNKSNGD
ncbi:Type I Iterative PKS [Myotisia sp. PD_48]|nr:Type I Iterative PKS [Myotisia sp. PD_48]